MMRFVVLCCFFQIMVSCHIEQKHVPNERQKSLNAIMDLDSVKTKSFLLDQETAPHPIYTQMFQDSLGFRYFTFLNNYNNSIYFYDYDSLSSIKKITLDKDGVNAIESPIGYHVKTLDSIYILSKKLRIFLTDKVGKISTDLSLNNGYGFKGNPLLWVTSFPMYFTETTIPFMETKDELLLTGQFVRDLPDSIVNKFKFTAHIDYKLDSVYFTHTYPAELYGNNYSWGGLFPMKVFPQLHPDGKRIIYSFVPSHDLYLSDLDGLGKSKKVYAGSKFAGTISSFNKKTIKMEQEDVISRFVEGDRYCAILYDKFRKVYYRFLRKSLPNAPKGTHWKKMNIVVIIMDEDFGYLGETELGPGDIWHWENSFVTKEGLNIEFIDKNDVNEDYLTFKIFIPKLN